MKKLVLTLLISLNLAMPAHAIIGGTAVASGGVTGILGGAMIGLGVGGMGGLVYDFFVISQHDDMSLIKGLFAGLVLLDGEKNSENNLVSVNVLNDIETLISTKIYTETEGNALKSEWGAFESDLSASEREPIFINAEQIQDMSPEDVVTAIQSQVGVSKLLAGYLVSKMGVQVQ